MTGGVDPVVRSKLVSDGVHGARAFLASKGEHGATLRELEEHLERFRGLVLTDVMRKVRTDPHVTVTQEQWRGKGHGGQRCAVFRLTDEPAAPPPRETLTDVIDQLRWNGVEVLRTHHIKAENVWIEAHRLLILSSSGDPHGLIEPCRTALKWAEHPPGAQ